MNRFSPPILRKDFVMVVHSEKMELCAEALSYLFETGSYLPIFSFRNVDVAKDTPKIDPDIYGIQRKRAEEFDVFLGNAIIENGGCENLLLIGLTDNQKSYLKKYHADNVLELDDHADIAPYLSGFGAAKGAVLECGVGQLTEGLISALSENRVLRVGIFNPDLQPVEFENKKGVVVIEKDPQNALIIAIGYGMTINTDIVIVNPMDEFDGQLVLDKLELWSNGDLDELKVVQEMASVRVGGIDFEKYEFATFFTEGIPYSHFINSLPTSQVNLECRPDFFIFNTILHERTTPTGSAVLFSPVFFKEEETNFLSSLFEFHNFYLRLLVGEDASLYNLKNSVENYPFDILHICSHGGDVGGTRCVVKFNGVDGVEHEIEFDHVFNVPITPYRDMHAVESLWHFLTMDGLKWKSKELKAKKYSHELYAQINDEISVAFEKKTVIRKGRIDRVINANAIKCEHFSYQANFDQIGGRVLHPIVFNNACWSWMKVSTSFLVGGCRGYIGSVCSIGNKAAVNFAKDFYNNVFNMNVVDAFFVATKNLMAKGTDPLYIYWGLHFSTLRNKHAAKLNRTDVLRRLFENQNVWKRKRARGEGSPGLLEGKHQDTNWLISEVEQGTSIGHTPIKATRPKKI